LSKVLDLLQKGSIISLISDAGTPSISDPGKILVQECIKNNLEIIPIPGPSSVSSAVSISGFSEKFLFYGFFPEKNKILLEDLKNLSNLKCSIVFFVSPKKINRIIPLLKKNFSGRKILICREMTKYYEEFIRTKIDTLDQYDFKIKGELTLVVSEKEIDKKNSHILKESDKKIIKMIINKLSIKEITNLITQNNKVSKKDIYNYCIKLKNEI
jgi:16S rRNA (cytidine1402-2'-O)-methyltransferase